MVLIPDVGAFLIRGSGLTVSSYETAGDFPVRMLITSLMTVALVYVACCYLGASSRLAKLLMAAVFVSFLMTLPWSAPLWRVHALTNFQFPWRFGSILTIAAVALYAMAMDKLIRERSSQNWRSVWILSCAAFMVVVVGMFAWRVQMRFTHPSTVDQALVRNVDNMYRSYVPGDQVAGFAHDAIMMLAEAAMTKNDLQPPTKPGIVALSPFQGVMGEIRLDAQGESRVRLELMERVGGANRRLQPARP